MSIYGERFNIMNTHHVETKAKLDSILAKNSEIDLNTDTLEAKVEVGNGHHASIDSKIVACDTGAVAVSSCALPVGAASESSLAALNGKVVACDTGAVAVSSCALPAGAASESSLAAMNAKIVSCNTGAVAVSSCALPAGAASESSLAAMNAKIIACNTGAVAVSSCALPAGAADSAKQDEIKALIAATNAALGGTLTVSAPAVSKSSSSPISSQQIFGMGIHISSEIDINSAKHISLIGSSTDTMNSHEVDLLVSNVSGGIFYKTSHSGYYLNGDFHLLISDIPYRYVKIQVKSGDMSPAMSATFDVHLLQSS